MPPKKFNFHIILTLVLSWNSINQVFKSHSCLSKSENTQIISGVVLNVKFYSVLQGKKLQRSHKDRDLELFCFTCLTINPWIDAF